jgi:hypothetical protein
MKPYTTDKQTALMIFLLGILITLPITALIFIFVSV